MDALFVGYLKEIVEILIASVSLCNLLVVANIIACILERRIVTGVDPKGIAAEVFYIVKLFNDTVKITDSVSICILKGLRINLIKYCIF